MKSASKNRPLEFSSATARLEDRVVPSHQVDVEFLSDKKAMSIAGSMIGRISCTTEASDGPLFHKSNLVLLTEEHSSGNQARDLADRKTSHFDKMEL
jgi:hypothetical protein